MYNTIGKIKYGEVRIERRPAEYDQKGRLNTASGAKAARGNKDFNLSPTRGGIVSNRASMTTTREGLTSSPTRFNSGQKRYYLQSPRKGNEGNKNLQMQ